MMIELHDAHEERRPRMKMDITIGIADQLAITAPGGVRLASRRAG